MEHGPACIATALDAGADLPHGTGEVSRPGEPSDNVVVVSCTGHFREDGWDQHWVERRVEAPAVIAAWRVEPNEERPHRALSQQSPAAFLASWEPLEKAAD